MTGLASDDGTAAYPASAGLQSWTRAVRFDGRASFLFRDGVRTKEPRRTSVVLHADRDIVSREKGKFVTSVDGTSLEVTFDPLLTAIVEPHIVVDQGRPGSVEQGEREERGRRLIVATPARAASDVEMRLVITTEKGSKP